MATYLQKLTTDMKGAMKAREKERLQVLRMVIAGIKQEQHRLDTEDLTDEQELQVLLRAVKTRKESVAQAREYGREDIADNESREIAYIEHYLPQQMTPEELAQKVAAVAAQVGYEGPKDTGKFMQAWMSRYKGQADGKAVQAALQGLSS
ncbi:MAG: GatB/YqeY domain-containing protein [Planctomycetota bacterium]